jgi:hypothetical protein
MPLVAGLARKGSGAPSVSRHHGQGELLDRPLILVLHPCLPTRTSAFESPFPISTLLAHIVEYGGERDGESTAPVEYS